MLIKDILHVNNGQTRTDDRYPLRIGSTVRICFPPAIGQPMLLAYEKDNQGNPKDGYLRTSLVTAAKEIDGELVVDTMNSRYIFT